MIEQYSTMSPLYVSKQTSLYLDMLSVDPTLPGSEATRCTTVSGLPGLLHHSVKTRLFGW